jgi:glycosyltransferase involved in cell wall biosynthesis
MEVGLNFEARIVGGGPLANVLRAQLIELKLEGYVELLGVLGEDETAELYRWADVFIYTGVVADSGDQDGLPNVIPEAMCAGLPVVSTAVAGVPEAIENEVSGRLLPLEDIAQWIEALRRLATDDEYYARLRKEARRWVEMEFDASANAAKLVAAWDDVMRITPQKT